MNISKVISTLIMQNGLYSVVLPFKDQITGETIPTENAIRDVLVMTTIPEYSEFVPWKRKGDIDISQLKVVDEKQGIYMLPAFLTLTPIKYVSDVSMPYCNTRGTYGDISPVYGINRSVQGVASAMAYMMVAGQMRSEPTFDYLGNNKIRLFGFPKTVLSFSVACDHSPNGETIPDSCYDSFLQLATLDLKVFLYNNLKYFEDMPTAFGSLKLKITSYESAESERNSLLDSWRETFHLDMDWEEFM